MSSATVEAVRLMIDNSPALHNLIDFWFHNAVFVTSYKLVLKKVGLYTLEHIWWQQSSEIFHPVHFVYSKQK